MMRDEEEIIQAVRVEQKYDEEKIATEIFIRLVVHEYLRESKIPDCDILAEVAESAASVFCTPA